MGGGAGTPTWQGVGYGVVCGDDTGRPCPVVLHAGLVGTGIKLRWEGSGFRVQGFRGWVLGLGFGFKVWGYSRLQPSHCGGRVGGRMAILHM